MQMFLNDNYQNEIYKKQKVSTISVIFLRKQISKLFSMSKEYSRTLNFKSELYVLLTKRPYQKFYYLSIKNVWLGDELIRKVSWPKLVYRQILVYILHGYTLIKS